MDRKPKKSLILLCSFLLPAGTMALVFLLDGICPFGGRSLGVLDMSHQYAAILSSLRDLISGKASPLYLPSMVLGGNMMGVLAYYLMSPLNLVTCLFSREDLLTAVSLLYILRVGLCGLTMAVYCGRRRGYGWRILVPAAAYGLMAYMTAYAIGYLWQDCLVLLPLAALGIARLAEGRGRWLYVLSLAGALAINFYIGYILCLFAVLFFLFELFSAPGREKLRRMADFALSSLAAGALAAAVLVPAVMSLAGGKADVATQALTLTAKFPLPELFSKLFAGAFDYEELTPVGLPNIFCGTVTLCLAVLYLLSAAVSRRRRLMGAGLVLILVLSFWLSAPDLVWHGMSVPTWYNYRYSFLFCFLLAAGADAALADLWKGTRTWHLLVPPAAVALFAALAFLGRRYRFIDSSAAWEGIAAAAACSGALWLLLRPAAGKRLAAMAAALLLVLHTAELGENAFLTLSELTATSCDPAQWAQYVSQKEAALALADTGDTFRRVESPNSFSMDRCEPMLFGYDGISHYSSNISLKSLDFLEKLGLTRYTDLFALYDSGVTAAADSLLAIRYVVADKLPKAYVPVGSGGTYSVWEDPYTLPMGWTADGAFAAPAQAEDCFSYIQALYSAAAPEVEQTLYIPAAVDDTAPEGMTAGPDGALTGEGSVTYTLTAQADGPLYGQICVQGFPGVLIFVNDQYSDYYATAQMNGSLYLGSFSAGETVTVQVQAHSDVTIDGAAFVTEDMAALAAYHDALAAGGCELTKLYGSRFTSSFTTGEGDSLLVLTLPYDDAWRVTLDGAPVRPTEVQDCLMAIPVTAGAHTLQMRYIPAGLIPGAIISAAAALACAAAAALPRRQRKA